MLWWLEFQSPCGDYTLIRSIFEWGDCMFYKDWFQSPCGDYTLIRFKKQYKNVELVVESFSPLAGIIPL